MAILKQNGTVGKVLRAPDSGKVLKQNYNFGNSFYHELDIYFDFPTLVGGDFSGDFTLVSILNRRENFQSRAGYGAIIEDSLNNNSLSFALHISESRPDIYSIVDGIQSPFQGVIGSVDNKKFCFWGKSSDNYYCGDLNTNGDENIRNFSDIPNLASINQFILGYGVGYSGFTNYTYSNRAYDIFFKRFISDSERNYIYNNKLGNSPLSTNDMVFWLKYNKAEIFDFGGTIGQAVGVRDYSGNGNHARMLNLPSGTLQEQLYYANANLFEEW